MNTTDDLDALVAAYLLALEQGHAPDPAEWIARHPDHAVALATFLADLGRFGDFLGLADATRTDLTAPYPGVAAVASSAAAGTRFAEYELLGEPLGTGGMGIVYKARLVGTSLVVALKQLRSTADRAATDLHAEIEAVAGLRHPNIVPIYHVGEHEGRRFFTMALVDGGSLDRQMDAYVGNAPAACRLVATVARAVHHAHQRRILHRDLKPSNILLDSTGEPLVADFGLAARLTEAGTTVAVQPAAGSLPWMAPETLRGATTLTTAVDVWALGAILYELLTGQRPFLGHDATALRQAILDSPLRLARTVNPQVPRDLEAICRRCLEKDPERRYESASAVALDLDRWLRDEPVRARPALRGERFARWCRRHPGSAAGIVAIAALLVAATIGSLRVADELEEEVVTRVCRSCEYEAEQVAGNVDRTLTDLRQAVTQCATQLAQQPVPHDPAITQQTLRTLVEQAQRRAGQRPFVNAFLLDEHGDIRFLWPDEPRPVRRFSGRDYFTQAPRDGVHVSRVYVSENDSLEKLAISTRFQPRGAPTEWVLAATVTTDKQFDLGLVRMSDQEHTAILVAPRDANPPRPGAPGGRDERVILIHPALEPKTPTVPFTQHAAGTTRPFAPQRAYRDPFAIRNPRYEGRWITGSAQVGTTELSVVVQQSYDDIIAPHRSVYWRLGWWLGGALVLGLVAFVGLRCLRVRR